MAKGRSSISQKALYQRKQPYTPKQRMAYVPCGCDPKMVPIGADKAADEKLTGGYDPNRICPNHFIALSANGTCIEGD